MEGRTRLAIALAVIACGSTSRLAYAQSAAPPGASTNSATVCISAAAIREVEDCTTSVAGHSVTSSPSSAPVVPHVAAPRASSAPPSGNHPGPAITSDPGRERLHNRSIQIAGREEELLVALVRNMRRDDPHRPEALLRLADTRMLLASNAVSEARSLDETIFRARQSHQMDRVAQLTQRQQQLLSQADRMRRGVIATYEIFVSDHATDSHMESVLYSMAFVYQELRDGEHARSTYRALIQRFPQSHYVPDAYLAFADYYFERAELPEARQFYERVVAIRSPDNNVYAYALYRLAWVLYNQQDFAGSLQRFYEVIDYGREHPDSPSAGPLTRTARAELVTAYGALYGVTRPLRTGDAIAAFRRYAADEAGAFTMLERLAELYQDNGQWPNVIAVYHELISQRASDDRVCLWQAAIARAVVASRPREDQMVELTRTVDVYEAFRNATTRSAEARHACRDAAARVLFDVASHWHLEVIGQSTTGIRETNGTRNRVTMTRTAQLYATLAERFPDLDDVTFPDLDRRDWPTRYRIAYYRADLLRGQGEACACGRAYDDVVDMQPNGELAEDAGYKAVLCYNDCAAANPPVAVSPPGGAVAPDRLVPRDFNPQERSMLRAFTRYACVAGRASSLAPDVATDLLAIRFRRAYLYYSSHRYEQAATLFRGIALSSNSVRDPEHLRQIAADLYLDSLNVLGTRTDSPRSSCLDTMRTDIGTLRGQLCAENAESDPTGFCRRVEDIECATLRLRAEALHNARRFDDAARQSIEIIRQHPTCSRLDEVFRNAAADSEAAQRLSRAIRIRERLVERYLPEGSPHAQVALYRLAQNYHAIQVFSRAADLYEQYAAYVNAHRADAVRVDPHAVEQASDALRQATIFRIALGEEARALGDASDFGRYFGSDPERRRLASSVFFSIGQVYQDRAARAARVPAPTAAERARVDASVRGAWEEVVHHYTNYLDRFARTGALDEQIAGEVALARGYWNLRDETRAAHYFHAAANAWGSRGEGEARIRASSSGDADASVERAREAVAEARFYLAEIDYLRFSRRGLPQYRGGASVAAFRAWESSTLRDYFASQREALGSLTTQHYRPLMEMRVPNWEIAATARAADAYYQFAMAIREAPIPPDIQRDETLLAAYLELRERFVQQFAGDARVGFERCVHRATELHWFNEWSQTCERRLNSIDARQYPLADEIRMDASLILSRPAVPSPVDLIRANDEL